MGIVGENLFLQKEQQLCPEVGTPSAAQDIFKEYPISCWSLPGFYL